MIKLIKYETRLFIGIGEKMNEHFRKGFMKMAENKATAGDRILSTVGKGSLYGAGGLGAMGALLSGRAGYRAAKVFNKVLGMGKRFSPLGSALSSASAGGSSGALTGAVLGGLGGLGVGAIKNR